MIRNFLFCITFIIALLPDFLAAQLTVNFSFSPDYAYSGKTIQFLSQVTGGNPVKYVYEWDFNDGSPISALKDPTHIFTISGCGIQNYYVKLKVTDTAMHIKDSITRTVHVKKLHASPPTAEFIFTPDSVCSGTPIQFTSIVTGCDSNLFAFDWNFNDGTTHSYQRNPSHTFNPFGCDIQNYNVDLFVTDTSNSSTVTVHANDTVHIKRRPNPQLLDTANSIPLNNCYNSPTPDDPDFRVKVINQTGNGHCIVANSYSIDWGDGTVMTGLNPSSFPIEHTYHQLGAYNLIYRAEGINGCLGETHYLVKNEGNPGGGIVSPGQTAGCVPKSFQFKVEGILNNSPATTYTCDFDDGTPFIVWTKEEIYLNDTAFTHTFLQSSCSEPEGSFTVKLTATNSCKSTISTVDGVEIWSKGYTMIADTLPVGCIGQCVWFTNISTYGNGPPNCSLNSNFYWEFGNGNTYNGFYPPCQHYNAPGIYTLTLISTSYCGNDTLVCPVTIYSLADALAVPTPLNGCNPLEVTFDNQSTGDSIHYIWTVTPNSFQFINGTTHLSKNPVIRFTAKAAYTVTLKAENVCSADTAIYHINVFDKPEITLPTVAGDCAPYIYTMNPTYASNGDTITGYLWHVSPSTGWSYVPPSDSNSSNPTVRFDAAGTYTMTVEVTNGCGTTQAVSNPFIVILPTIAQAGSDTSVCLNVPPFLLHGTPGGGLWTGPGIINQTTGLFDPEAAGIGSVQVKYALSGNCPSTDSLLITVKPIPVVTVGNDLAICIDANPFLLTGDPAGGTWTGNGITDPITGLFDPAAAGNGIAIVTYTFTDILTDCSNSDLIQITVNPLPVVSAPDTAFCNQPVPEQLIGNPPGGSWFGENVTPQGTYTPNGVGTDTVIYSFTDSHFCTATDTMFIDVAEKDTTIDAGPDRTLCENESLQLTGTPPGGRWSGHNVNATGFFDPTAPGIDTLIYSKGVASCLTMDSVVIQVLSAPAANYTATTVCLGDTTHFQDISLGGGVPLAAWQWDFGDDSTSVDQNPVHRYLNPGAYPVRLIVTNANGCNDTINRQVIVNTLPEVTFTLQQPACTNRPYRFTNTTTNAVNYAWDFGDGTTSTDFAPLHAYADSGYYLVKLDAYSQHGCFSTETLTIYITPPPPDPFFNKSVNMGCGPLPVFLTINDSLVYQNSDASFFWDFGNGITSATLIPRDTLYYPAGVISDTVYHISFSSKNYCDSLVFNDSVIVSPVPSTRFAMNHDWECSPVTVIFKNNSFGHPGSFYWDFGDGTTSAEYEPSHTFTTGNLPTTFNITLISSNVCGADTLSQELLVKPNTVDAFFTADHIMGCEGDTVCFFNHSSDTSNVGISTLSWNFGDGQGSSEENPCYIYEQPGTYIVSLHVDNGCGHDEAYDTILINPSPQLEIQSLNEACMGDTLFFDFTTNVDIASKIWYFGDGDSSLLSKPFHRYTAEGAYDVTLKGVSANGYPACIGTTSKQVMIKPTPDARILTDTAGCAPLSVTFQGDSGSYHLWDFGDNSTPSSNPSHVFNTPGLFRVKLTSENSNMCKDFATTEIRVFESPVSQFTYTSSGGYPEHLTFTNISTGATACFWDFGNGKVLSSCDINEPIEYKQSGDYTIYLKTTNQFGCTDTASINYSISFKGLFIPNAFSPEHPDPGVNLFLPKGISLLEYTIQIFDTWGNLIWQSSALEEGSPSQGWDGRDEKGEIYPQDVYVWKVSAKFTDGTNWTGNNGKNTGTVTLIR